MNTPELITELLPHEVFVFGSNLAGIHGAGAAKMAYDKGWVPWGAGSGWFDRSYAIPTKGHRLDTLTLSHIETKVHSFLAFAQGARGRTFLVTPIGCGLAGYKPSDIAPMFKGHSGNVILPKSFTDILYP